MIKASQTTLEEEITFKLKMADKSDEAFSWLIRTKSELERLKGSGLATDAQIKRWVSLMAGIPSSVQCDCCGFSPLVNVVRLVGGRTVGPECAQPGHAFPCKRGSP